MPRSAKILSPVRLNTHLRSPVYLVNTLRMRYILSLFLLCVSCSAAYSCANTVGFGTTLRGRLTSDSGRFPTYHLKHAINTALQNQGEVMEERLRSATSFEDRSDYCVALMFVGRAKEAVERLEKLENEKPNEYFIAANLGTAYELSGNNEKALEWIKEGIRRYSDSHEGTEWLHVKILEAKIAQQKDPDYFKKHSVLNLDPLSINGEILLGDIKITPKDLKTALQYQLHERLQFVKPPDASVASLLVDYAAVEAATKTLESAKSILNLALEYGYPPDKVTPLIATYDRRIAFARAQKYGLIILLVSGVIGFFVWAYKRGHFVLSSRDVKGI